MAVSKPQASSLFDSIKKQNPIISQPTKATEKHTEESTATKPVTESSKEITEEDTPTLSVTEETPTTKETTKPQASKAKRGKNMATTFYMSPEVLEMIKIGSKAYGGNSSLYLRNIVINDFEKNEAMYRSLPDIRK